MDSTLPPPRAAVKSPVCFMAKIQFTTPEGQSGEVELSAERLTLGRADDNSIVIAHESVSSHHGEFVFDGASWVFNDLGSTNGTWLDRARITAPTVIPVNTPIRVGRTTLQMQK